MFFKIKVFNHCFHLVFDGLRPYQNIIIQELMYVFRLEVGL